MAIFVYLIFFSITNVLWRTGILTSFNFYKYLLYCSLSWKTTVCLLLLFFLLSFVGSMRIVYSIIIIMRLNSINWNNLRLLQTTASTLDYGLSYIHPTLLYSGVVLVIARIYHIIFVFYFGNLTKINHFLLELALLTGGLWGCFLDTWGFYWVYDPVEYVAVIWWLYLIILTHTRMVNIFVYSAINFILWCMAFTLAVRFGVVSTLHSFATTSIPIWFWLSLCVYMYTVTLVTAGSSIQKQYTTTTSFLFIGTVIIICLLLSVKQFTNFICILLTSFITTTMHSSVYKKYNRVRRLVMLHLRLCFVLSALLFNLVNFLVVYTYCVPLINSSNIYYYISSATTYRYRVLSGHSFFKKAHVDNFFDLFIPKSAHWVLKDLQSGLFNVEDVQLWTFVDSNLLCTRYLNDNAILFCL